MIINSRVVFRNANFFAIGEKVLARGENYVSVSKADYIDEDEIVYLDYSKYEVEMAEYDSIKQGPDMHVIVGKPGCGKTEKMLTEMGKTVTNVLKRPCLTFLKPTVEYIFVLTSFTKAPIESLPDILKRMSLTSKSLMNDIKNVPDEWVKIYRRGDKSDWVKYVWGRAKNYYERYKKKNYLYEDTFKANLMPFIVDHNIRNINKIVKELNKKVILYVEEASLAPAFLFSEIIKKAEKITCTATERIRLYDRFLPAKYQETIYEFAKFAKNCRVTELPEIDLEVDELIVESKNAKNVLEKIINEHNTIAFISDGTMHPKRNDIITKTVFTASSGAQYDVVVYARGKITTDDVAEVYRKIAKSKATELFIEIIPSPLS